MKLNDFTTTRRSVVTYIDEDGETVSTMLWDARWEDGSVTGIDPATWCPVTITSVQYYQEL